MITSSAEQEARDARARQTEVHMTPKYNDLAQAAEEEHSVENERAMYRVRSTRRWVPHEAPIVTAGSTRGPLERERRHHIGHVSHLPVRAWSTAGVIWKLGRA